MERRESPRHHHADSEELLLEGITDEVIRGGRGATRTTAAARAVATYVPQWRFSGPAARVAAASSRFDDAPTRSNEPAPPPLQIED